MQAKENFDNSISEVTYLNVKSKTDISHYKVYFKVIILLLCAKLEKYVKDSTNEYLDALLSKGLSKEQLPEKLVVELIKNELLKKLRVLHTDPNRVLTAELNMGLDHITLRKDLNAISVLELLTK